MNSLKELREAIRVEIDPVKRAHMQYLSDEVVSWMGQFCHTVSADDLKKVNAYWARAHKAYENRTPVPDPNHPAGSGEVWVDNMEKKAA